MLVERSSKPAFVVLSPAVWNALTQRLEPLEDAVKACGSRYNHLAGVSETTLASPQLFALQ